MAFEKPVSAARTVEKDFDGAPATCRCGQQSALALATCVNTHTGAMKTGPASEFCGRDNINNPNWILQDWWRLQEFRGWCSDCLQGRKPAGQRTYGDLQVRSAWRWLIGEISAGGVSEAMSSAFPKVKLSDSEMDEAVMIVNREAFRADVPEAVPEKYKLAEVWGSSQ
mgnify:FL=1